MDFYRDYWCEYWYDFDQPSDFWGDAPDFILHGPQLPYSYREFALDGAASGVIQEPAPWVPPWHSLTHVAAGLWRDVFGDYWTDYSDEDGPCWCEAEFGPTAPPVQGPHERWDPLF